MSAPILPLTPPTEEPLGVTSPTLPQEGLPAEGPSLSDAFLLRRAAEQRSAIQGRLGARADTMPRVPPVQIPGAGKPNAGAEATGASDVARGILESPEAIAQGVLDAAGEVIDTTLEIGAPLLGIDRKAIPFGSDALQVFDIETDTGKFIKFGTQFMVGFLPIMRATKGIRLLAGPGGTILRSALAGSLADLATVDESEKRLSALIQEIPALKNPITEFLNADPGDSLAEGKLKQGLEGLALGAGGELLAAGMTKGLSALGRVRQLFGREPFDADDLAELAAADAERTRVTVATLEDKRPLVTFQPETSRAFRRIMGRLDSNDPLPPNALNELVNSINLRRIGGPEDIQRVIRAFAEDLGPSTPQTFDQVRALANVAGLDPEGVVRRTRAGGLDIGDVHASFALLRAFGDDIFTRRQALLVRQAVGETISEADSIDFFSRVAFTTELAGVVRGTRRTLGRLMGSLRIQADTIPLQRFAIDGIMESVGQDLDQMLARIGALRDGAGVSRLAFYLNSGKRAFTESWVNSILSGLHTTATNLLGNAGVAGAAFPERLMAASLRSLHGGEGTSFKEAFGVLQGSLSGVRDGMRIAAAVLKDAEEAPSALQSLAGFGDRFVEGELHTSSITAEAFGRDTDSLLGRGINLLGEIIRLPTARLMRSGDEFFKAVGYRAELRALAERAAGQQGLSGRAYGAAVQEILANPPEQLIMESIDAARLRTLQAPLGQFGKGLQAFTNRHFTAKFFLPFVRTPTNILKMATARTPLAPFQREWRDAVRAGGARADLAIAQVALGSLVGTEVANLTLTGRITGAGPSDPAIRDTWLRSGWRPWSVLLPTPNGSLAYVSYNRLDPVGVMFGLSAATTEILGQLEDNQADEAVSAFLTAISAQVLNKTYLRTISNVMQIFTEPSPAAASDRFNRFVGDSVGSFLPYSAFFRQLQRGFDPDLRDTDELPIASRALLPVADLLSRLREGVPSYSESLPSRLNLFGEPVAYYGGFSEENANDAVDPAFSYWNTALRLTNPLNVQEISRDPVDAEMLRLSGLNLSIPFPPRSPRGSLDGIPLTASEESFFLKEAGQPAKRAISAILAGSSPLTSTYRSLNDSGKALLLSRLISDFRVPARDKLRRTPRLIDAARELAREQQAPGLATLGEPPMPEPAR